MTWRALTVFQWSCDECECEVEEDSGVYPIGWVHTMNGRDLCRDCQR